MNIRDISTPITGSLRSITFKDKFPPMPITYEVFYANDEDGSFVQIAGPLQSFVEAQDALKTFVTHPEFKFKKVFLVECNRRATMANFNPNLIRTPINDG